MKIKMLKTATGPLGSFVRGQTYDFHNELEAVARDWIRVGSAVQVGETAVEPRAESPESPALPPEPEPEPKPKPRGRPRKTRAKKAS